MFFNINVLERRLPRGEAALQSNHFDFQAAASAWIARFELPVGESGSWSRQRSPCCHAKLPASAPLPFFDESACARRVLKALARSRRPRISHSQQAFSALNRPSFPLKSQKMTCLCRFFLPFVATATRRPAVFSAATAKDPTEGSARRCNVSGTIE